MSTREQALNALFNLISSSVTGLVLSSRRLQLWDSVSLEQRPAFFMVDHKDTYGSQKTVLTGVPRRTIDVSAIFYTNAKDPNIVGSTLLNNIADSVDSVLTPANPTGLQTLGGLVTNCWIDGDLTKVPGDIDGDGLLIIPIKVLLP